MPKNRMTLHDPKGVLPPVTVENVDPETIRLTQVDKDGKENSVVLSTAHVSLRNPT